jgi:DNA-binding NarL/FixJ family response regulator
MAAEYGIKAELPDLLSYLTKSELGILQALSGGLTVDGIAEKLCISRATVRTHLRSVNIKLNVGTQHQAVAYYLNRRIAELEAMKPSNDERLTRAARQFIASLEESS